MTKFFECFGCHGEINGSYVVDPDDPQRYFCSDVCLDRAREWDAEFTPMPLDNTVRPVAVQDDNNVSTVLQYQSRCPLAQIIDDEMLLPDTVDNRQME